MTLATSFHIFALSTCTCNVGYPCVYFDDKILYYTLSIIITILQAGGHYSHITVEVTAFYKTFVLHLIKNRYFCTIFRSVSLLVRQLQKTSSIDVTMGGATIRAGVNISSPYKGERDRGSTQVTKTI